MKKTNLILKTAAALLAFIVLVSAAEPVTGAATVSCSGVFLTYKIQPENTVVPDMTSAQITRIVSRSSSTQNVLLSLALVPGNVWSVRLPREAVSAFMKAGLSLTVRLPEGLEMTADAAVLSSLLGQESGTTVTFTLSGVPESRLTAAQLVHVGKLDYVYEVGMRVGGRQITHFKGSLALTVRLFDSAPAGVWRLPPDGALEWVLSRADIPGRTITFFPDGRLSHFLAGADAHRPTGGLPFSDVHASDWFYGDVKYAYESGLMKGVSATSFAPALPVTRGMVITVLGRYAGAKPPSEDSPFPDVHAAAFYAPYVAWAKEQGITTGTGKGLFEPERAITREELAVMLARFARAQGIELAHAQVTPPWSDAAAFAPYAWIEAEPLFHTGIFTGKPGNRFDPNGGATRAEMAAVMRRFDSALLK